MRKGCFTQTRRSAEKHMVKRFFSLFCSGDEYLEVLFELLLADKIVQVSGLRFRSSDCSSSAASGVINLLSRGSFMSLALPMHFARHLFQCLLQEAFYVSEALLVCFFEEFLGQILLISQVDEGRKGIFKQAVFCTGH